MSSQFELIENLLHYIAIAAFIPRLNLFNLLVTLHVAVCRSYNEYIELYAFNTCKVLIKYNIV